MKIKTLMFLLALPSLNMAQAQRVVTADAVALLNAIPKAPTSITDAYQRSYRPGETQANAKPYYQASLDQLTQLQAEAQKLLMEFYRQNPMGYAPAPATPGNRVSAKDQSAMDAATSELAQKMMTDKSFAQKFAQMNQAEQEVYITKLLAEKGLKPAQGTPNTKDKPIPGMDVAWAEICTDFSSTNLAMERYEQLTALQERYEVKHSAVNVWAEGEIKKLPMISFGEYGHDHDPKAVKMIQKQALVKHRDLADAMLKEADWLLAGFREQAKQRYLPLNDALKKVGYGESYNFGLHYSFVLQTQTMMLADIQVVLDNEMNLLQDAAHYEYDLQHFEANQ